MKLCGESVLFTLQPSQPRSQRRGDQDAQLGDFRDIFHKNRSNPWTPFAVLSGMPNLWSVQRTLGLGSREDACAGRWLAKTGGSRDHTLAGSAVVFTAEDGCNGHQAAQE
ncbi:Golgi-Resident Adenosine 3',5'-Bisphosphate 3'-Phosphatase [Manis pentadactyla]|nr:Golgi-Resident Adenosine 3',5'-Bisphosphate 3'-Phosphatase [Manis pentadactyla]